VHFLKHAAVVWYRYVHRRQLLASVTIYLCRARCIQCSISIQYTIYVVHYTSVCIYILYYVARHGYICEMYCSHHSDIDIVTIYRYESNIYGGRRRRPIVILLLLKASDGIYYYYYCNICSICEYTRRLSDFFFNNLLYIPIGHRYA